MKGIEALDGWLRRHLPSRFVAWVDAAQIDEGSASWQNGYEVGRAHERLHYKENIIPGYVAALEQVAKERDSHAFGGEGES